MLGVALFEWINGKALANIYMLLDATLDQYRIVIILAFLSQGFVQTRKKRREAGAN